MSNTPTEIETGTPSTTEVSPSPGGMHRPAHSPADTIDIAGTDDVLHDAALRNSSLRVPR